MWTRPAVAGAAIVAGLALGVGAGGASVPVDTSSTVQVDQPRRDHDDGQELGHVERGHREKAEKAEKRDERDRPKRLPVPRRHAGELLAVPPGLGDEAKACFSPARYTGGPLGPCPRKPHPHGKVVPVGPRPYSETEE
jgi:hypothetical protein